MAVVNAVTKDSVSVVGFSDGGYTGYELASKYPDRVKKLIAIGATELYPSLRDFSFDVKQAIALDTAYWNQQFKIMPDWILFAEDGFACMKCRNTLGVCSWQ